MNTESSPRGQKNFSKHMKKNQQQQEQSATSQPSVIIISSITEKNMSAIENLSLAILECAKALNSTNTDVSITNCVFNGTGVTICADENETKSIHIL